MRWQYIDSRKPAEVAFRDEKLRQIDAWWREFAAQSTKLQDIFSGRAQWDLPGWMHQHLGAIDERLMWEFGPAVSGPGHRLVITPEAERWLRPLLATILERAPRLPEWEFYGYRLPENIDAAKVAVEARTGADISGTLVEARLGEGRRVELVFRSPKCRGDDDNDALSAAFVISETLLGEELLDCWIGGLEVAPLAKPGWFAKIRGGEGGRALPLDRLRPTVEALVGSLAEQLSPQACHETVESANWATIELQPQEQLDYVERTDLLVAVTGYLEMWQGAHGGGIFHSGRFSRHGETFCYVKIDGSEGLGDSRFADRSDMEDALNDDLIPIGVGCVVGGGTGLRYSYIDLALADRERGLVMVRDVLRSGGVPPRSWIQFFDDDLAHEWLGIRDDSPAPPM